jgi:L-threonine kinase
MRSAILNQEVLPKAHLDLLLGMRERYEALGVVIAHSGTHLGLLLDPNSPDYSRKLPAIIAELKRHSSEVSIYYTHDFQETRRQTLSFR